MKNSKIIEKILNLSRFTELNPVQKEAIRKGLLEGKNLVIASPTASGKTFIAELAAIKMILEKKEKVVYMVPLVALASEKYKEFKKKYAQLGIKVALSIGDLDSADPFLRDYHLIVVSNEKMDSLIRHGAEWIKDIGLIVVDEIHLLDQPDRGPTLEITLTLLRKLVPNAQILSLSATIKNAKELAEWLNADTVISEWRPVKLYKGVAYPYKIEFLEKEGYELDENLPLEVSIIKNTLSLGKQALFFVSTRRSAESLAEKLSKVIGPTLSKIEKKELEELANKIKNVLEVPTVQCKRIAKCVKSGSAFHHAGLLYKQRLLIEENFRNGLIKVIVATPTLAFGINLPSFRVVMRDLKRYYPGVGAVFIPVLDVQQMLGRCVAGDTVVFDKNGFPISISEIASKYFKPNEIGKKNIKEKLEILSVDLSTFQPTFSRVLSTWKRRVDKLIEVETRSGKILRLSSDHPVLIFRKTTSGKASLSKVDNFSLYKKVIKLRKKFGYGPNKIIRILGIPNKYRAVQHWLYEKTKPTIGALTWKKAKELKKGRSYKDTDHIASLSDFYDNKKEVLSPTHFLPHDELIRKSSKSQFDHGKRLSCIGNIHPDLIKTVREINKETYAYDLGLDKNHNFVANGIVVHNSGRPQYDPFGEGIILGKSEQEAEEIIEHYIHGEPEEITSKLTLEPVLRMHTLALIASGFVNTRELLMKFFQKTFYAHQYGDVADINEKIQSILEMLINFKFLVEKRGKILPTRVGKRVSELYIDPLTAHHFIECLKRAMKVKANSFSYLHMIANTLEMKPFLSVSSKEFKEINDVIAKSRFLERVPNEFDLEFDEFLKSVKTALIFEGWINELTEDQILSKFRVTPGELYTRLRNVDWLLYASQELALLLGFKKLLKDLRKIRVRVKYGVKEELIPLVRLEQVGRVRARKLYDSGLKRISDLRKVPLTSLERIIGPKIAVTIKKQLGEKVKEIKEQKQTTLEKI